MCGALTNGVVLQEINTAQNVLCKARYKFLEMIAHRKDQSFTDMTVPELTRNNFEEFDLDFQGAARR